MPKRRRLWMHLRAARAAHALALLLTLCAAQALAQREAPASVAGRVREGERGVAGVNVVVMSADPSQRFKPAGRARTDAEGRYRITGVPPGKYVVTPMAPAYVLLDVTNFPPGKPLTLSAGDSVEDTDFRVIRGGVITGRVLDEDGNPVVMEPVSVTPEDPKSEQQRSRFFAVDQRDLATDDRGVYRVYGIQPGRYRVSVGGGGRTLRAPGAKYYRRTFYPSATDESQAKVVEVTPGAEVADVDITLGSPEKTFRASGRFVFADTNQPAQVSSFGYGMLDPATGRPLGEYTGGSANARGEFQAAGLAPGRYKLFAYPGPLESVEWYSDSTPFEITDSDVSGLVVKLHRGSTVSGVVVVEGLRDRAAAARMLTGVRVYGAATRRGEDDDGAGGFARPVAVGPDGSFQVTGVRPGRLRLDVSTAEVKGLAFSRVEVNGAEQRDGINIAEGAQVTGVRVVLVYGTATLRGQVSVAAGGALPQGARTLVVARRVGGPESRFTKGAEADTRGLFQMEGLPAGEYEVQARSFGPNGPPLVGEPVRVSVNEGGDVTVNVTLAQSPNAPAPPEVRQQ
ncbi:MAG TPA: carboxypeptidase-like regulatory domain-containing protein [Pyrinomonadaceae bacterium]|nr:carboxypeptidase-like regulatory domain-containing protein [Pyrinomonadaceae bacterium]